jgi:acyl-CoA thioester hydrolase
MRPPDHVHRQRVLYADTDQAGIVYHANYLRFLEAGRAELFRARGIPYAGIEARGLVFPVVEVELRYRRPARYDELLDVRLWVEPPGGASLVFFHEIRLPDGEVACTGRIRLACTLRSTGRPEPLPEDLRLPLTRS